MDELDQYIASKYKDRSKWFVEEVKSFNNQEKVREVEGIKEYLAGNHNILRRKNYEYNGKVFEPKRIVLQYAKTLLDFQKSYLLNNPITLTGDEEAVKAINKVNRKGKYERKNRIILDLILKYGDCYEYVYQDKNKIKSKIIEASNGFPVYNKNNKMVGFVEAYVHDGVEYYNVFKDDVVEQYKHEDGRVTGLSRQVNLTGMPIHYKTDNELSDVKGRSEIQDWIGVLDSMEDLLSKYQDSVYHFMNPIPVAIGQQLKGEGLPSDIIGGGVNLDDGADFKFEGNQLDFESFQSVYKTLMQALLDVSSTPAVSMNKSDVSNLSEVSIKLLFSLANVKASMNEQYVEEGLEERHERIRTLLEYDGVVFDDEKWETIDIQFSRDVPSNNTEVIENIKELREIEALSLESLLEKSPYTTDIQTELDRLANENIKSVGNKNEDVNENVIKNTD